MWVPICLVVIVGIVWGIYYAIKNDKVLLRLIEENRQLTDMFESRLIEENRQLKDMFERYTGRSMPTTFE